MAFATPTPMRRNTAVEAAVRREGEGAHRALPDLSSEAVVQPDALPLLRK